MGQANLTINCDADGTTYTTSITNANLAIDSMHSGATMPAENIHDGKLWLDTSDMDNKYKIRIGDTWYTLADFDGSKWYFEQAKVATKLETARDIGGVSFDGTTNISLPGVNTAGSQNTSGKAATAGEADTSAALTGTQALDISDGKTQLNNLPNSATFVRTGMSGDYTLTITTTTT